MNKTNNINTKKDPKYVGHIFWRNKLEIMTFLKRDKPNIFLTYQPNTPFLSIEKVQKKLSHTLCCYYRYKFGRGWYRHPELFMQAMGVIERGKSGCRAHAHLLITTTTPKELLADLTTIAKIIKADTILLVRSNGCDHEVRLQPERYRAKIVLKAIDDQRGLAKYLTKEIMSHLNTEIIISHNMLIDPK